MMGILASMTWNGIPIRLARLYIGLTIYGFSSALMLRSGLGLDPWDVFHQGIAQHTGLAIGTVVIIVGAIVMLGWIPIRQRPGLGTLSNVILIGVAMNVSLEFLHTAHGLPLRAAFLTSAIVLCGIATGLYVGADFGPGPRDGLMTGYAKHTGRSIRLVRTLIEITVLAVGWLMGGTVGVGTVLYAACIGPLSQFFLGAFSAADSQWARKDPLEAAATAA
jgi:uncharacterized membrane protein YczE